MDTSIQLKKYVAMIGEQRVITVLAKNDQDAKDRVSDQLSKPGRYAYLTAWVNAGKVVISEPSN